MRYTRFAPSSLSSREPSFSTVSATGRPQGLPSSAMNPVRKSMYSPVGSPFTMGTCTTLWAVRAVPGAVQHGKALAGVFGRERGGTARLLRIELDVHGGRVRGEGHVGLLHLACQVGTVAGQARIFVVAHVVPGPAEEVALFH